MSLVGVCDILSVNNSGNEFWFPKVSLRFLCVFLFFYCPSDTHAHTHKHTHTHTYIHTSIHHHPTHPFKFTHLYSPNFFLFSCFYIERNLEYTLLVLLVVLGWRVKLFSFLFSLLLFFFFSFFSFHFLLVRTEKEKRIHLRCVTHHVDFQHDQSQPRKFHPHYHLHSSSITAILINKSLSLYPFLKRYYHPSLIVDL